MESPVTERHSIDSRMYTKGGNLKSGIVIHWWGDPNSNPTFDAQVRFLTHYHEPPTSAHFVAEDGRVAQLSALEDRTWHAKQANDSTIGIECNPRKSDGDVFTVARLIAWIWEQIGERVPIGTHNFYVATACPGVWEPLAGDGVLRQLATQIIEGKEPSMSNGSDVWNFPIKTRNKKQSFHAQDFLSGMADDVVQVKAMVTKAQADQAKLLEGVRELLAREK